MEGDGEAEQIDRPLAQITQVADWRGQRELVNCGGEAVDFYAAIDQQAEGVVGVIADLNAELVNVDRPEGCVHADPQGLVAHVAKHDMEFAVIGRAGPHGNIDARVGRLRVAASAALCKQA